MQGLGPFYISVACLFVRVVYGGALKAVHSVVRPAGLDEIEVVQYLLAQGSVVAGGKVGNAPRGRLGLILFGVGIGDDNRLAVSFIPGFFIFRLGVHIVIYFADGFIIQRMHIIYYLRRVPTLPAQLYYIFEHAAYCGRISPAVGGVQYDIIYSGGCKHIYMLFYCIGI